MSIKILTDIQPGDPKDTYPLMDAKYLKGGFLVLDTKAELATDSPERRTNRLYFVKEDNKFYQWNQGTTSHVEVPITDTASTETLKSVSSTTPVTLPAAKIVIADFTPAAAITQPLPDMSGLAEGSRLYILNKGVRSVFTVTLAPDTGQSVNGQGSYILGAKSSTVELIADKTNSNWVVASEYKYTLTNILDGDGNLFPIESLVKFDDATITKDSDDQLTISLPAGTGGSGIEIDDGVSDAASLTKLNVKGMKITELPSQGSMAAGEVEVTAGMNIHMMAPNAQYGNALCNELIVEEPLQVDDTPTGEYTAKLYIDHSAYEPMHVPGMLAYVGHEIEVVGKYTDSGKHHKGALWFDDIIVPTGPYIVSDKFNKAYGIQEFDGLDPNISGGNDYLIAFRVSLKGLAPNDGFVRIALIEKGTTPLDTGTGFLTDVNGHIMAVERHYKADEKLGVLDVMGVVNAKGLQEFQCIVIDDFTDDRLVMEDRTEGATGLLIQTLTSNGKTGDALQQFEIDTNQNIEFSSQYLGEGRLSLGWLIGRDEPVVEGSAGQSRTLTDGLGVYNISKLKMGVQSGHFIVEDNGIDIADFNFHKIFAAEETEMLRGKQVKVTVTLTDKDSGWNVNLMKWTGKPDEYTPAIFKSRANTTPTYESDWTKVGSLFISEDAVSGDHTSTKTFTVPNDANNYAIMIYPVQAQRPLTLKLKEFKVDVVTPFIGYALKAPELVGELHLASDSSYKAFTQDRQGFQALRYTLNTASAGIPLPAGIAEKGSADIVLDNTVNQIPGSAARGGEGALSFNVDGSATISTQVRLWSEKAAGTSSVVTLWWATVSSDGNTFTKIADSELTVSVKGGTKNLLATLPTFTRDVEVDDRIALRGSADTADGAFLECIDDSKPLVSTSINFKELVVDSGDTPGTGMDMSIFDKVPQVREVGIYNFFNKNRVEIPLPIPADVTMAVLAIHRLDGANVRPLNHDYLYDNANEKMIFTFSNNYTGQILLEFFA